MKLVQIYIVLLQKATEEAFESAKLATEDGETYEQGTTKMLIHLTIQVNYLIKLLEGNN